MAKEEWEKDSREKVRGVEGEKREGATVKGLQMQSCINFQEFEIWFLFQNEKNALGKKEEFKRQNYHQKGIMFFFFLTPM